MERKKRGNFGVLSVSIDLKKKKKRKEKKEKLYFRLKRNDEGIW